MDGKVNIPILLDGTFFKVISIENDGSGKRKVLAECTKCKSNCRPGEECKPISGFLQPTSNFKKHLKRKHPEEHEAYESYSKLGRARPCMKDSEVKNKPAVQTVVKFSPKVGESRPRTNTEELILDYVINSMSPLSVVDNPAFKKLVKGLNPHANVLCRQTLASRIAVRYGCVRTKIVEDLKTVSWVCITADIWSSSRRSFIGVTCHWIGQLLERRSAVLSLKRFKGLLTNDKIAESLHSTFFSYGLQNDKILCVVTDNASNFVKAFIPFGLNRLEGNSLLDGEMENETDTEDDEDPVEIISDLDDILTNLTMKREDEFVEIALPTHHQCASHTLSLVATIATTDAEKAFEWASEESTANYTSILRAALGKCQAIWNRSSKSPKFCKQIKDLIGESLITPVPSRWSSLYDSIRRLLKIKDIGKLNEVFDECSLPNLSPTEVEFLEDYHTAMKPISCALEKLQSENSFYFGYLAPTIFGAKKRLTAIIANEQKRKFTVALASSLEAGLESRFHDIMTLNMETSGSAILAAVTHPYFKLRWLPENERNNIKTVFVDHLKQFAVENPTSIPSTRSTPSASSFQTKDDTFFEFDSDDCDSIVMDDHINLVELECLQYLRDKSVDLESLINYPNVKCAFLKFNTPLPSSAPVERLFSNGGMILRAHKSRLSDEMFERLTFLKLNSSC